VRIFVGTEPVQHRAERVLVWSIEQVRDPSRVYEIHLMKDLTDFDRRRWLTGFTNYRFAIPHLAGGAGRAIYNDVDQIYLGDPAELFDADMGEHGFLALSGKDTAVMLIDCARMAAVWPLDAAKHERRKAMEAHARAVAGLWGPLERVWHARDWEYAPGITKLLHYTTIHTQPWQPFPRAFVYLHNPAGDVWHELERSADAAGFEVFSADRPSSLYGGFLTRLRAAGGAANPTGDASDAGATDEVLRRAGACTVLDYGFGAEGAAPAGQGTRPDGRVVTRYDAIALASARPPITERYDAVVCRGGLEHVPDDDIPWVVDDLFRRARRVVVATVADGSGTATLADGTWLRVRPRGRAWWETRFAAASARNHGMHWVLTVQGRSRLGRATTEVREGGRCLEGAPRVWILADEKAGHTTQSIGLADALGWPYELKRLRFNALNRLSNHLLGATRMTLDGRQSAPLAAPWPDVVIGTGRCTVPVARWIREQSRGRTRLVQLGRKGADVARFFDVAITCRHFRLPVAPGRIQTVLPLSQVTPERLSEAAERWRALFAAARRPLVALVVGGDCARYRLDAATAARMGKEVRAFAEGAGGSVFAVTSPRTSAEATAALSTGLGDSHHLHRWRKGERDNPYLAHLASADVIVVTGDSESMLAEAAAAGKPTYIYPIPERPSGLRRRLSAWVTRIAYSQPRKKKGTIRPQQGREYLCARLIENGIVRPPHDLGPLHQEMIRMEIARPFGVPLELEPRATLREVEVVAHRVRELLGLTAETEARPARGLGRNVPGDGALSEGPP
jgi:mitochondrial fission protein ELM1